MQNVIEKITNRSPKVLKLADDDRKESIKALPSVKELEEQAINFILFFIQNT